MIFCVCIIIMQCLQHYLHKYGYLENCTLPARRRKRHLPLTPALPPSFVAASLRQHVVDALAQEGIAALPECSEAEVKAALKTLQAKFDLRPSGRLDEETKSLMSRGRCGNADTSDVAAAAEWMRSTKTESMAAAVSRNGGQASTTPSNGTSTTEERMRRHRRAASRLDPTPFRRVGGDVEGSEDAADGLNVVAELHRRVARDQQRRGGGSAGDNRNRGIMTIRDHAREGHSDGRRSAGRRSRNSTDYDPEPAYVTRRRQFEQIKERRLNEGQLGASGGRVGDDLATSGAGAAVVGRNLTDDEKSALVRMSRSDGGVVVRQRRKRRRRTIVHRIVTFDGDVSEGPAGDRTRFQKDENSPVQWRLLDDGVSGKIPLTDQTAVLELAFRMWSEVIPLKFNEVVAGLSIKDMDVVIAFAKRKHLYY